jgi:hypothetical protein
VNWACTVMKNPTRARSSPRRPHREVRVNWACTVMKNPTRARSSPRRPHREVRVNWACTVMKNREQGGIPNGPVVPQIPDRSRHGDPPA